MAAFAASLPPAQVDTTPLAKITGEAEARRIRDLELLVRGKKFREDLFYRLARLRVQVPALAARRPDIPALASHFLQQYRAEARRTGACQITDEALTLLCDHPSIED